VRGHARGLSGQGTGHALRIDHVLYAVRDLDAAGAEFAERYGLGSVAGGTHPGWGTANRIIPLGESYLELIAAVDPAEAAASEVGGAVLAATADGDRLFGWCVATGDLEGVARRLGLEVVEGSRARPDGTTLSWRLAGTGVGLRDGALPFFIEWDGAPELHPGAADADHRSGPSGIAWVEVSGDERRLRDWLGEDAGLPVRATDGVPSLARVAIATADGELVLS
jgi:Glyoxalase-like domain